MAILHSIDICFHLQELSNVDYEISIHLLRLPVCLYIRSVSRPTMLCKRCRYIRICFLTTWARACKKSCSVALESHWGISHVAERALGPEVADHCTIENLGVSDKGVNIKAPSLASLYSTLSSM